jgi:UDP-GlcNAc:undecaprenyl-phosphate GlcNAc-1-phosphate transferase
MIISSIILFLVSTAGGLLSTLLMRYLAIKLNIVNAPNPLVPQHNKPIAYLGGVGIFSGFLLTSLYLILSSDHQIKNDFPYLTLGIIGFGYLLLGLYDDINILKARTKFIGQVLLAIASVSFGFQIYLFEFPILDFIFSVLLIVTIVNATNLTDVCDGLVSGCFVVIFLIYSIFNPDLLFISIPIAGATLGFLYFNFPKASIFLGDAGSHFLGFLLAAVLIYYFNSQSVFVGITGILLIPGVFLFEMIFLIVVRTKKGLPWWKGSPDHFSLRLQSSGLSKIKTDLLTWSVCGIFVLIAFTLGLLEFYIQLAIFACLAASFIIFWRFLLKNEVP